MTESEWLASDSPAGMLYYLAGGSEGFEGNRDLWKTSGRKLRLFAVACCRQVWQHLLTDTRSRQAVEVAEKHADGKATGKDCGLAYNSTDNIRDSTQRLPATACLSSNISWGAYRLVHAYINAKSHHSSQAALLRDIFGNPFRPATLDPVHVTRQAIDLGQAAYEERERDCPACKGRGYLWKAKTDRGIHYSHTDAPVPVALFADVERIVCKDCKGDARINDGTLDPFRLSLVADALEEAGCAGERCVECEGEGSVGYCSAFMYSCAEIGVECRCGSKKSCEACRGVGCMPHPILAHLRSPGPHVRGCWALDLVLGKD